MARTEPQRRRRASNERRRYVKRRLAALMARFPALPPAALARASLRQLSARVRRAGEGQGTLSVFNEPEPSSGLEIKQESTRPDASAEPDARLLERF